MIKLCFDYGHGGSDSGACYKGRKESNDVLSLGRAVAKEVRRHGIIVDETRTSDVTVSLNERSNFENRSNYDYFISFHRNAYKPEEANGIETYVFSFLDLRSKSLADKIQSNLVSVGFLNRGVKVADFHVLRETKASAILIEIGFIDNSSDNNLFDNKKNNIIKAVTKGILTHVGMSYKECTSIPVQNIKEQGNKIYRVMAGSYAVRENAEKQIRKLKLAGFDATIMAFEK